MAENLRENGLLVTLAISNWTARKFDRGASAEFNSQHKADPKATRVNKSLIPRDYLKNIQRVVTELRDYHYKHTLAWDDNGNRLLPTRHYFDYVKAVDHFKNRFNGAVGQFVQQYAKAVHDAQRLLGDLFNANEYPDVSEIKNKFHVGVGFRPIPSGANLKLALAEDEVERIKEKVESETADRFKAANKELFERAKGIAEHMIEILDKAEKVSHPGRAIKKPLLKNISEVADLIEALNADDLPEIKACAKDLRELAKVDSEALREVKSVREKTRKNAVKKVDSINKRLGAFMSA